MAGLNDELLMDIDSYLTFGHVPCSHWVPQPEPELVRDSWWRRPRLPTLQEAAVILKRKLREATARKLSSQTTAVVCLSGGIDSSVTAFLLREILSPSNITALTLDYGDGPALVDKRQDLETARSYARRLGIRHETVEVTPQFVYDLLPEVVWRLSRPYSGVISAAFLNKAVSGMSRVWTGDWADEIYGSYKGPRDVLSVKGDIYRWRYGLYRMTDREKVSLYTGDMKRVVPYGRAWRIFLRWPTWTTDSVTSMLDADWASLFPDHVLWSTRQLLDISVVTPHESVAGFMQSLPSLYKVVPGRTKRLLREAFEDDLPEEILDRGVAGRKTGFVEPSNYWMSRHWTIDVQGRVDALKGLGIFDMEYVRGVMDRFLETDEERLGRQVWGFYMLSLWLEAHGHI